MRNTFILICVSIFLLAFSGQVMADSVKMKDNPKCKQWHSVIGQWSQEVEYRDIPGAEWTKRTARLQFEWILDGSFVQVKGQNSEGSSSLNTFGYDERLGTEVGGGFQNKGFRWVLNSGGWSGTTWSANSTHYSPDGRVMPRRCKREYNAGFTSVAAECQKFTDGNWWTDWKGKATRVK